MEPKPCFVCDEPPTVGSFLLMDMRHRGWTCLCPNKHHETNAYYSRDAAVKEWNEWVESEGITEWEDE
jgi:hypothetical protein